MRLNLTVSIEEEENNMGFKDTKGKVQLRLIPYKALAEIAKIREYGINKYGDNEGWKTVPKDLYVEAAARHCMKFLSGEIKDDESGLDHIAHAACSLILALGVEKEEVNDTLVRDIDDNWVLSDDVLLSNGIIPKGKKIKFKCDETNDWCDNGACS